jgi:hypothetical protein
MSLTDFISSRRAAGQARAAKTAATQVAMISSHKTEYLPRSEIIEPMHIEFRNDYDIEKMHKIVMSKIHHDTAEVTILDKKIAELTSRLSTSRSYVDMGNIFNDIKSLENLRDVCGRSDRMDDYKNRANKILSIYRNTPRPPIGVGTGTRGCYYPTEIDLERINVITSFLSLAAEYIKLTFVCTGYHTYDPIHRCKECSFDLTAIPTNSNGCQICPGCSTSNNYRPSFIQSDASSSVVTHRVKHRSYEDVSNFEKARKRYFGELKPKVDLEKLTIALDQYFIESKYPHLTKVEICKQPRDERGRHVDTTIELLKKALKQTGYSCYNDMNFITHFYWGWELPEGSDKEDLIMDIYQCTKDVWNTMTPEEKGRSSNIPVQYRLFKILQILDIPCDFTDFKMSHSNNIQQYDNAWRIICSRCTQNPIIRFIKT